MALRLYLNHNVPRVHQLSCSVGAFVRDLELVAKACKPEELSGRVEYLPL